MVGLAFLAACTSTGQSSIADVSDAVGEIDDAAVQSLPTTSVPVETDPDQLAESVSPALLNFGGSYRWNEFNDAGPGSAQSYYLLVNATLENDAFVGTLESQGFQFFENINVRATLVGGQTIAIEYVSTNEALFESPYEPGQVLFQLTGDPLLTGVTTTLIDLEPLLLETPPVGNYFGLLP